MKKSRVIRLGRELIGGDNPPLIQTMITTPLTSPEKAVDEADYALDLGCRVVRTAFKDNAETQGLEKLVKSFRGE